MGPELNVPLSPLSDPAATQATHLDFQEIRARQPTGIIQPSAGPYLNTSSVVTDPGAQVVFTHHSTRARQRDSGPPMHL